ncbi:MAG: sulfotransferase [Nevskia sp.]|nr:sulfotransferase [Nevskia sp.]
MDAITAQLLREFDRRSAAAGAPLALNDLCDALAGAAPPYWRACANGLQQRGAAVVAVALLERAVMRMPAEPALRLYLGQALAKLGDHAAAETVLRQVATPDREEAVLDLAAALRHQGKLSQAAGTMADLLRQRPADAEITLGRLRFINGCQRQPLAAEMCERELARGLRHPHLLEFAGRMALALGRFDVARRHYFDALESGIDLNSHFVLQALSGTQRYTDAAHPDFALFESHLERPGYSALAQASIRFALGKAYDDVGNFAAAAAALRAGNALVRGTLSWTRANWNTTVQQLMAARYPAQQPADGSFTPVFVVGLPRSGTTLVADRLGRHPRLRNRGELNLVPYLDRWVSGSGQAQNPKLLREVSRFASAQLVQDDAPAQFYLDKNPLNFRFLSLIAAVLPQSRIIYCRRNRRDNALSIWNQFFARGDDNGYAYDFADIAAFADSCEQLMRHWSRSLPLPLHEVEYEKLIEAPEQAFGELGRFLGLDDFDPLAAPAAGTHVITTSSAWQARQPIYSRSIERWRAYAPYVPELEALL